MTKQEALVLATEALREVGLEQEAKWVENAGAVRQLLSHPPTESSEDGPECAACGIHTYEGSERPHELDCAVLMAWQLLGDPRFATNAALRVAYDFDQAEDAARRENYERNRCDARGETRCRLVRGHTGVHDFTTQVNMRSMNSMLRSLYSPAMVENLAPPHGSLLLEAIQRAPQIDVVGDPNVPEGTGHLLGLEAWLPITAPGQFYGIDTNAPLPRERPLLICCYCKSDSLSSSALSQRLTCDVCGRVQSYEEARR